MGRWTAPSDRDYLDEPWAGPATVDVTCRRCEVIYEERADEPPPYLCPTCAEAQGREERARQRARLEQTA